MTWSHRIEPGPVVPPDSDSRAFIEADLERWRARHPDRRVASVPMAKARPTFLERLLERRAG